MANKKWAVREIETNNDNINNSNLETVYYSPKSYQNVLEYLPTVSNNGSAAAVNNAKKEYEIKSNYYKNLEKNYRNKANESNVSLPYQKSDFTTPSRMIPDNFTILRNDEKSKKDNISQIHSSEEQEKLKSGSIVKKELSNPTDLDITPKLREGLENKKRYEEFVKKTDIKSMLEELPKARNEVALSKYNLDLEKVNKEDTSFYDKTLGRFIRGGASMLPSVNPTYIRDDGVEVNLPTYNDLKEQKTIQNYTTGIGKFAGDAAANLGRIAVSAAINNVIPYAGTAIYFGDMFVDQYNNNLLNGYDESASLLNASVGTATEAITEKLLGGVSKKLFGGNSSELSVEISKGISKLTKNKTIVNIFSNGASEAIEEFLQTYAEKLNEQLTLKKEFDAKELFSSDTLSEAIYSAGIGAVTGGVLSGFGKVDSEISNVVDNNIITSNMIENIENQQGRTLTKNEKRKIGKYIENTSNKDISPEKENLIKKVGTKIVDANGKATYNTPSVGLDLVESYRAYNGNINKINDINNIQNYMNVRNIDARFDATAFNNESVNALWETREGKNSVVFNPKASEETVVEEIATHEMLHDIMNQKTETGNNLFNEVLNYAKTIQNYRSVRNDIRKSYSKYYDNTSKDFSRKIDEEVVAKTLEKQLGTQEYINRIINNKPNIAQKLYRWVINKLQTANTIKNDNNKVTGFKSEKIFWEGVKNRFEKAYRSQDYSTTKIDEAKNTSSIKYSKAKLNNGEDIVVSDDINGTNPTELKAKKTLENMLGIKYINKSNSNEISIESRDINKYLHDGYNNFANSKLKKRIAGNYGEIIEIAKIDSNKSRNNYKGSNRGKQGFDYYDVNLAYPIRSSNGDVIDYKYYESRLVVRKDNNNNFAYDLDSFKQKKGATLDKTKLSIAAGKSANGSFSSNNISQLNSKVNGNASSIKYSIQNIEKNTQKVSEALKKEIIYKTKNNLKNDTEIKYMNLNDLIELQNSQGGYRENNNEKLISSIKNEGFKEPITLVLDSKGNVTIENGNHRLNIAESLGINEIPVKFVESYAFDNSDVIWYDKNKNFDYIKKFQEDYLNGINRTTKNVNSFYEKLGDIDGSDSISNELDGYGKRAKNAVQMVDGKSELGKRSQSETTNSKNDLGKEKKIELDNSSFSFDKNAKRYDDLNQTNYIEYFTKENGDIRINLIDTNNNLVNQFSSSPSKEISKLLGENIGKYILENSSNDTKRIYIGNDINNLGKETDYFMNHRPSNDYGDASNFESNMSGIFEHPEWYMNMNESYNIQSLNALKKVRNNPEADITIYRATIGDKINPGDWVTPSKKYAEYHNKSQFDGKGNIIEMKVKAKDVLFAGDDINEFGYFPTKTRNSLTTNKELMTNLNVKGTKTKIGELFGKESHLENKQTNKNMILPIFKESKVDLTNSTNKSLPTYNDIKKLDENKLPSFKDSVYQANDASKNINLNKSELKIQNINKISDNKDTINKLVDSRNKTLKNIDDQIKLKRELYSKKQNKDTKVANIIQQQVITMEARKKSISEAYKQKIDRLEERNKKLSSKENITNLQRKNVSMKYMDLAESLIIDNIDSWKDKSAGIQYKSEKMERNIYDIIPDKKVASKIVDTYITPLKIAEVNQKNFINEYVERIKKLNLTNEESVAVQLLGESKFNISNMEADTERAKKILNKENAKDDVKSNAQFYLDALDYMKNNNLNIDKIQNAIKVFRRTYEELFLKINSVLKEQGFKEMEYRENYFPHFVEEKATSKIGKLMEKLGWKKINNNIPTDIAGITDTFKPGKTFFNHLLHRRGPLTEYNALKGFDNYIAGASNLIYLTEPIQKLRAFENEIRYLHSEKGIQEKYNEIIQSDVDTDTKESQITQLFANASNPLNNFVTELRSYTDGIANKKSELDRRLEQAFNRGIYSTMSNIQSRVSANMVGLNISSALTNFIPITQAYSQVSTKNMIKAIKSTISNSISSDNFVENSEFLSNRLLKSEKLYQTKLEKINEKTGILFDAVDSFTSNVVVRAKYLENIDKGMNPSLALKNADTFANNVMAGRDKASLPTIFNAKNPFIKLFSSFQLEVNNQYRYMLKDLPNDLKDEALSKLIGAFAKMFFGAWFYNIFSEKITGRKSAFSPADIVLDGINTMSNENNSTFTNGVEVVKDVAGELPFLGNILGGGRLPISSALPNLSNTIEAVGTISKKDVKEKTKKTAINNLIKELSKPVFYIVPPFGGGQAKKTIEGLSMYANDIPGSYTSSGRLRFVADKGFLPVAQAAVFGQYASKNARDYFDNNYTPLSEKQIEEFKSLNVGIDEYRTYLKKYAELNKITSDKDSNNNVIKGSAKAKKIYQIMNDKEKYNEKEINYILYKLSTETDKINLDDILLLDNNLDCYKYYFSLSNESREKYKALILNNNLNQSKYISSVKKIDEIKEKYSNTDNPYSGSMKTKYKNYLSIQKRNEIFKVINDSNISKVEKIILYENAGYSISNYKQYIFSYINSLNISKEEKEKLWNYLYDN